jgi:hypothetical protein
LSAIAFVPLSPTLSPRSAGGESEKPPVTVSSRTLMSLTLDFRLQTQDSFASSPVVCHQPQHLLHGGLQTHRDGAADDAVADIQLDQVRHAVHQREVTIV